MILTGIPGSPGIAIGRIRIFHKLQPETDRHLVPPEGIQGEVEILCRALDKTRVRLCELRDKTLSEIGAEEARVFEAQLSMLQDPALKKESIAFIEKEGCNAAWAVTRVVDKFCRLYSSLPDEYLRARSSDMKDIGDQLAGSILGVENTGLDDLGRDIILVAYDLAPSDTARMDKKAVRGFVTCVGSVTSHTAILARSLGIPALIGVEEVVSKVCDGDMAVLDGNTGQLIVNPDEQQMTFSRYELEKSEKQRTELKSYAAAAAATRDGKHLELMGNIGSPQEVEAVLENGAAGIGLFRTEFLFMTGHRLPDEQEQFEAYRSVAEKLAGRPLIIRTLDIGGDKQLPSIQLPAETNPFLGWRAIRICLDRPEIFRAQLRAILRASAFGDVRILYPMIIGLEEIIQLNALLEDVKNELARENIPFDANIKTGIMIETPAAAAITDILSGQADFFSIGTNDLCQYTLAVDRMNPKVAGLYQPMHPAVLRLIRDVIRSAHATGKPVGMCGEMAGDPMAAIVLLGLGLDEFSMNADALLSVKKSLNRITTAEAELVASEVLRARTAAEAIGYVREFLQDRI